LVQELVWRLVIPIIAKHGGHPWWSHDHVDTNKYCCHVCICFFLVMIYMVS
jgi:hypothetical protein